MTNERKGSLASKRGTLMQCREGRRPAKIGHLFNGGRYSQIQWDTQIDRSLLWHCAKISSSSLIHGISKCQCLLVQLWSQLTLFFRLGLISLLYRICSIENFGIFGLCTIYVQEFINFTLYIRIYTRSQSQYNLCPIQKNKIK